MRNISLTGEVIKSILRGLEGHIALFRNRNEAGKKLGLELVPVLHGTQALVLALPRGGVPVAFEVARALHLELDVFPVRKLGMPGDEELAIGALAGGNIRVLNQDLMAYLHVSEDLVDQITAREQEELRRQESLYRADRPAIEVRECTVVLIDDGLATGATMLAGARALKAKGAARIIVAVPVAARQTCDQLRKEGYEVVCVATPYPFEAVGIWYDDFSQVTDDQVRKYLEEASQESVAHQAR